MAPALEAMTRVMGATEENWTKATALGTGTAVVAIALRRVLETDHVEQAVRKVLDQHALLRSQAVENAKGKLALLVTNVTPRVKTCSWPTTTSAGDEESLAAAVDEVIRDELNTPFVNSDNKTSPPLDLFQVHMYSEESRGETIILFRFHSGALDRPSAYVFVRQFFTALNAIVDGQSVRLAHNPGKDSLLPTIEELVPKGKASKGFFQKATDTVGYALSANKYALLPFQPSYGEQRKSEPFKSDILTYTLGKAGTAGLIAACKKENTTLAAALAAAFLKTAANTKELKEKKKDDFSFTSLVDCRKFFDPSLPEDTIGNFVAGIPQSQQVKEGVSFWELARSVSATTEKEVSKSKHFSEIPVLNMLFSQVLKHPGVTPQSSMRTALFSLFVDEPSSWTWQSTDMQKLQVASVSGPFPSMHGVGPCFAIGETLLNGNDLSISFIYPQPVYSRSQMQAFCSSAMELLTAAAKECLLELINFRSQLSSCGTERRGL